MEILLLSIILVTTVAAQIHAQQLSVVVTTSRLPTRRSYPATSYDGNDSIYLFGGDTPTSGRSREIVKYSIGSGSVAIVGTMAADTGYGVCSYTDNGDVYYFGGRANTGEYRNEIWHLNTSSLADGMTTVATLPYAHHDSASVWDWAGQSVYIFGGVNHVPGGSIKSNRIYKFSKSDNSLAQAGEIMPTGRRVVSSVFDARNGTAYVFGGQDDFTGYLNEILAYDTAGGTVTKLGTPLPSHVAYTCAVWTGSEGYILGGFGTSPRNNVTRFTPSTGVVESLEVIGWPSELEGIGCEYVERLNRIYVFGGWTPDGEHRDQIMYIDL